MTKILIDRATAEQAFEALKEFGYHGSSPRWERTANALKAALEQQPVQEPTPWRDMVVVSLVREGVNKHKARELADHFATQPLPVQEPVACRFCHSKKGCWAWQCYTCDEIDDVQQPAPSQQQAEPVSMRMPKVGDKVICLEDESLGEVVSLTAGGSPDILFADGSRGTYLLHEFAELFGYVTSLLPVQEDAFEGWVKIDEVRKHFDAVGCGTIYKHGGEGRVLLRAAPPKREWVGLTEEEIKNLELTSATSSDVRNISAELKERNG